MNKNNLSSSEKENQCKLIIDKHNLHEKINSLYIILKSSYHKMIPIRKCKDMVITL